DGIFVLPREIPVGGIYTVIKSKVPVTAAEFGNRYVLLGPLNHKCASAEVEVLTDVRQHALKESISAMSSQGVNVVYGRWLIDGAPQVVLFDLASAYNRLDAWKGEFYRDCHVPLPPDPETNDAVVFGYLVAWFLGEVTAERRARAGAACRRWSPGVPHR
ncbi:MAG: glycogen synthase, partial [Olpidium bornovanus]